MERRQDKADSACEMQRNVTIIMIIMIMSHANSPTATPRAYSTVSYRARRHLD